MEIQGVVDRCVYTKVVGAPRGPEKAGYRPRSAAVPGLSSRASIMPT